MKRLEHLMQSWQQADEAPAPVKADLLLYAPCPVKLVVKERIEAIAAAQCPALTTHIPMGCTSVDPYDPCIWKQTLASCPQSSPPSATAISGAANLFGVL